MDENTKAFLEVGKKLHKDNEETLAELKKISKPSSLQESITENKGEILSGIGMGIAETKGDLAIAKGHNLGIGVTTKNGVDIVPGGEPSVDEKSTLYGITQEFYANHTVQTLVDSLGKVHQSIVEQNKDSKETIIMGNANKGTMDKLFQFFRSDSGDGFFGGLADKFGITKLRKGISKFFNKKERQELFKAFGGVVATKIKNFAGFILGGLKNLGAALLKPLGNIVKGIIGLPKKILGFFGVVFDMIGRLALLGGGIFALAKLTEFLRGVGPEGKKKFTDKLIDTFLFAKGILLALGEIIMKVVIPALGTFADAILGVVKFLAKYGLIPGVTVGRGEKDKRRKEIAKEVRESKLFSSMTDEQFAKDKLANEMIELGLKARTETDLKDALLQDKIFRRGGPLFAIKDLVFRLGEFAVTGDFAQSFRSKTKERDKAFIQEFKNKDVTEGEFLFFGSEKSIFEQLEDIIDKNVPKREDDQSAFDTGNQFASLAVPVTNIDNSISNGSKSITVAGNAFNYSVYS